MLQSEFTERTGVQVNGDEYAEIEKMYLATEMDKDQFCAEWKKNKDNELVRQLMDTVLKLQEKCRQLASEKTELFEAKESLRNQMESELKDMSDAHKANFEEFGRKMIVNIEDEGELYDIIEEEFGMDFICKVKLEENIELEDEERLHILKMFQ